MLASIKKSKLTLDKKCDLWDNIVEEEISSQINTVCRTDGKRGSPRWTASIGDPFRVDKADRLGKAVFTNQLCPFVIIKIADIGGIL